MPRRKLRQVLLPALVLGVAGCDWWYYQVPSPDQLWHVIPWFNHMITSRAVHPYSRADVPRNTVPGTVPITGGEADWQAEWAAGKTATADALKNPIAAGTIAEVPRHGSEAVRRPADLAARGDTLYQNFCLVCHGATGAGDGPVGRRVAALSLLTPRARAYSDGYLYSIVRYGRGLMPPYGDRIYDPLDRWAVVNHVRKLQAAAPPPDAPPAPGGVR